MLHLSGYIDRGWENKTPRNKIGGVLLLSFLVEFQILQRNMKIDIIGVFV